MVVLFDSLPVAGNDHRAAAEIAERVAERKMKIKGDIP
jgi:hypothetical protein